MGMETSVIERVFEAVEISGNTCTVAADVGGNPFRTSKSTPNIATVVFAVSGDSYEKMECKEDESVSFSVSVIIVVCALECVGSL